MKRAAVQRKAFLRRSGSHGRAGGNRVGEAPNPQCRGPIAQHRGYNSDQRGDRNQPSASKAGQSSTITSVKPRSSVKVSTSVRVSMTLRGRRSAACGQRTAAPAAEAAIKAHLLSVA